MEQSACVFRVHYQLRQPVKPDNAGFRLDNLASSFQNIDVKIDTGCSISTIPVKKLKVSDRICRSLKEADINNNVISVRSYGIETGGVFHPEPITKPLD